MGELFLTDSIAIPHLHHSLKKRMSEGNDTNLRSVAIEVIKGRKKIDFAENDDATYISTNVLA